MRGSPPPECMENRGSVSPQSWVFADASDLVLCGPCKHCRSPASNRRFPNFNMRHSICAASGASGFQSKYTHGVMLALSATLQLQNVQCRSLLHILHLSNGCPSITMLSASASKSASILSEGENRCHPHLCTTLKVKVLACGVAYSLQQPWQCDTCKGQPFRQKRKRPPKEESITFAAALHD